MTFLVYQIPPSLGVTGPNVPGPTIVGPSVPGPSFVGSHSGHIPLRSPKAGTFPLRVSKVGNIYDGLPEICNHDLALKHCPQIRNNHNVGWCQDILTETNKLHFLFFGARSDSGMVALWLSRNAIRLRSYQSLPDPTVSAPAIPGPAVPGLH